MGRWFFIGEATREVTRHGPTAVLDVDFDWDCGELDLVVIGLSAFARFLMPRWIPGLFQRRSCQRRRATFSAHWQQHVGADRWRVPISG
jgi:hypothetical protein